MTLRRAALVVCALCALGTGGRGEDGITAAVERSPYTYFHYASSIWWGAPVHVSVRATAVEGDSGGAVVEVRKAGRLVVREDVLLRRNPNWRVVRTTLHTPTDGSYCDRLRGLETFFHSCVIDDFGVSADPYVKGPLATRAGTPAERAQITSTVGPRLGDTSCVRFAARVSSVDDRYALVSYRYVPPFTKTCSPANGVTVVERALGTWRVVGDGSSEFPCRWGGPGVMRSLLGTCVFGPDVR